MGCPGRGARGGIFGRDHHGGLFGIKSDRFIAFSYSLTGRLIFLPDIGN